MTAAPSGPGSKHVSIHNTDQRLQSTGGKSPTACSKKQAVFITAMVLSGIAAISLIIAGFALGSMALLTPGLALLIVPIVGGIVKCIMDRKEKARLHTPEVPFQPSLPPAPSQVVLPLPSPDLKPVTAFDFRSLGRTGTPLKRPIAPEPGDTIGMALNGLHESLAQYWGIEKEVPGLYTCVRSFANGIRLTMAKQNITHPFDVSVVEGRSRATAIVNAANPKMQRYQGGTNEALTQVTSPACWASSTEGKTQLKPGEATGGLWESATPWPGTVPPLTISPRGFIQALGPNVRQATTEAELQPAFIAFKTALQNAFQKAEALGCSCVQLGMLSGNVYAPAEPSLRKLWLCEINAYFEEVVRHLPDNGVVQHVVLVDLHTPPALAETVRNYCFQLTNNS